MSILENVIRYNKNNKCETPKYKGLNSSEVKMKRIAESQKEKGKED